MISSMLLGLILIQSVTLTPSPSATVNPQVAALRSQMATLEQQAVSIEQTARQNIAAQCTNEPCARAMWDDAERQAEDLRSQIFKFQNQIDQQQAGP